MVNARLRDYILASGLKYQWVAERAGIPYMTFSNMINGRRKLTADEFFRVCDVLGVSADVFNPTGKYAAQEAGKQE